jgi:CBS domain-containing protein
MRDISIDRIMTTNPSTVGPEEPIAAAKQLLESGDIHHLPVAENGMLVGIVSSSDLLWFHLLDDDAANLMNLPVREIMETNPVVLQSGANLREAATRLSAGAYHALPVIESDRTLVGIVTTSDLVGHLLHQIPRGDGSIQQDTKLQSASRPSESDISMTLAKAKRAAERDGELAETLQVLLYFRDRNRLLERACQAAELYIRSGQGEREHSILLKRLADIEESGSATNL